jgi:hypothetical protein
VVFFLLIVFDLLQSSFLRLCAHRLSHHFKLRHSVIRGENQHVAVVCYKTLETRIPPVRLIDLLVAAIVADQVVPAAVFATPQPRQPQILLLRRPDQSPSTSSSSLVSFGSGENANSPTPPPPSASVNEEESLQQREAKYHEAKLRIFGKETAEELAKEDQRLEEMKQAVAAVTVAPVVAAPSAIVHSPQSRESPPRRLFNPNTPAFAVKNTSPSSSASSSSTSLSPGAVQPKEVLHLPVAFSPLPVDAEIIPHIRVWLNAVSVDQVMRDCAPFRCKSARVYVSLAVVVVFASVLDAERAARSIKCLAPFAVKLSVTDPNGRAKGTN